LVLDDQFLFRGIADLPEVQQYYPGDVRTNTLWA
jgi:hypothetical protein